MKIIVNTLLFFLLITASTQIFNVFTVYYTLLDEIILLILSLLYLIHIGMNTRLFFNTKKILLGALIVSVVSFSLLINYYSFQAFILKLVYYLKPLLAIIVTAYFSKKYYSRRFTKLIFKIIILLCLFSFIEFFYVQYVDRSIQSLVYLKFRGGIYRAASLTGHPISLAMMALIGFIYNFERQGRYKNLVAIIFLTALIISGSRVPLLLVLIYIIYKSYNLKIKYIVSIRLKYIYWTITPLAIVIGAFAFKPIEYLANRNEGNSIRGVSITNGVTLLEDPMYLLFGTGVGSFGTYESVKYGSPIYSEINYPHHYKELLLESTGSGMESFLFMTLFEMGILGLFAYYFLIIGLKYNYGRFELLLITILIIYSLVYPLYTLPFIYLLAFLFPHFNISSAQLSNE